MKPTANKKFVFISDFQAPFHLNQAVALVCAFVKDYKPDLVILGGDIIDFVSISGFTKVGRLTPNNVVHEIESCENEVIIPIKKAAPNAKFVWIEGNHEFRLTRYIALMAKPLEGLIDIADALGCKRNGIEYIASKGGNGIYRPIKALTFMHGWMGGMNPAKAQYERWGGSLVTGHTHKETSWRRKLGNGNDHISLTTGCLCKDPDWTDVDNYTRGFIAGWMNEDTNEFGLDEIRISGDNHTRIYSNLGEYNAIKTGKDTWVAKRIKSGGGNKA